jgi:hypothetical protein
MIRGYTSNQSEQPREICQVALRNVLASSLPHFWEHTVGSDHAPMALRAKVGSSTVADFERGQRAPPDGAG